MLRRAMGSAPPQGSARRIAVRALKSAAVALAAWLVLSLVTVRALTQRFECEPRAVDTPEGCVLREVETRSADGLRLAAWSLEVPQARGVVLGLHGSGDSRRMWIGMLGHFAEARLCALLPDVRAHGASAGDFNDFGFGARRDVQAWIAWLDEHRPGLPRVVVGTSMGAAATLFAAEETDLGALGYVLDACYRDLDTAQRNRFAGLLPAPLAALATLGLRTVAPLVFDFDVERRTPLAAARALAARGHPPILVTGALGDAWALPQEQRDLAEALGPHTELALVEGAGHFATCARDPAAYAARIAAFFGD
jgi:alpha-beta hydrolase superfamily lysophospholipase